MRCNIQYSIGGAVTFLKLEYVSLEFVSMFFIMSTLPSTIVVFEISFTEISLDLISRKETRIA